MKFDATYFSYTNAAYENNYVVSKNVVKKKWKQKKPHREKVLRRVQGKSFIRRNQARVHICSSCLALPLALRTRVWQPRVWQTSFRPVRHTRSYLSNYISCRPRRFLFCSFRARAHNSRLVSSADSLCFRLSRRENRCFVQDTSDEVPITCAVVALSKREFQCISTFA